MAEQSVKIDGAVTTLTGAPTGAKFYVFSIGDVPGVVAANTFMSVFNPVGSGKLIQLYQSIILPWATASTSVTT